MHLDKEKDRWSKLNEISNNCFHCIGCRPIRSDKDNLSDIKVLAKINVVHNILFASIHALSSTTKRTFIKSIIVTSLERSLNVSLEFTCWSHGQSFCKKFNNYFDCRKIPVNYRDMLTEWKLYEVFDQGRCCQFNESTPAKLLENPIDKL